MTVTRQLQIRVLGMFGVLAALAACANRRARLEAFDTGLPIVAARQQWNAALLAGDTAALARVVEDSAAHVSPQFTHIGRAAFLAQFVRALTTRPGVRLVYTRTCDSLRASQLQYRDRIWHLVGDLARGG